MTARNRSIPAAALLVASLFNGGAIFASAAEHVPVRDSHVDRHGGLELAQSGARDHEILRRPALREVRDAGCPPGLAKKANGCLPPGQAKKWRVGQRLPDDVVYHPLPPDAVTALGPPPPGHRYVRVDSDILLIAIGTALVVEALSDPVRR